MPTPTQAVIRGHLTVTVPVVAMIAGGYFVGAHVIDPPYGWLGIVLGALVAWPVWSFLVPRWRDWVVAAGVSPEEVQPLAVRTGLLWPAGSFFERTEFKRRNGKRGW